MKVIDKRCGWSIAGTFIDTLPAHLTVNEDQMRAYYGATPGDKNYDELVAPSMYDRLVLQRARGDFVIIPVNPDIYMTEA